MRTSCLLPKVVSLFLLSSALFYSAQLNAAIVGGGWDDIPEEELDATEPRIDPNAACEFLYRRLKIDDGQRSTTVFRYHNRAKIFTEAGVEEWSKIDIPYESGWYIRDLKARVIYPDGTTADLKRSDIHRRQVFKVDRFEGKALSFSLPGLTPGCIVEYKWDQHRKYWVPGLDLPLRADWPTWDLEVYIKPFRGLASTMRFFNTQAEWKKHKGGYLVNVVDQPAISDKAMLGARKNFEPFIYLGYAHDLKVFDPEKYWGYRGGALVDINKDFIKAKDKEIKKLSAQLFEGAQFNDDKLKAAYEYCANEIVNIDEYTTVYTEEEIEELKENDRPTDTIRNGYGTRYDINAVFASLATAGGFQAYLAQVEDHREFSFNQYVTGNFNLSSWVVAIKEGQTWRFFDPGSSFLPFERLNPNNQNANAIVADKKYYYMERTPAVDTDFSQSSRIAKVTINEYGDLEAEVRMSFKGYSGLWRKRLFVQKTESEIEEHVLEEEWRSRLSRAVISDFKIENMDKREEPLQVSYSLKIPGYADVLGDRLIFNPCLFENGTNAMFPEEERTEPVAFDYNPLVIDKIMYRLPEGFEAENQYACHDEYEGAIVQRRSMMEKNWDTGEQIYQRMYFLRSRVIGGGFYGKLKQEFDYLLEADTRPMSYNSSGSGDS